MLVDARDVVAQAFRDPVWWLSGEWLDVRDTSRRWNVIRRAYTEHDPRDIATTFEWDFTPIERRAWEDIRSFGLRMYPQYPVGRRFVDFGDPERQIAVELDGRAYHDLERDLARDEELRAVGWSVFHVPGWKTFRVVLDPFLESQDEDLGEAFCERLRLWGNGASDGFFWALWRSQRGAEGEGGSKGLRVANSILRAHQLHRGTA